MEKKSFQSLLLIAFFLITLVTPINTGVSSPLASEASHLQQVGMQSIQGIPHKDVVRLNAAGEGSNMLQFKAGGDIMGFQPNKVYLASTSHALSVEFLGTTGVMPAVESANPTLSTLNPESFQESRSMEGLKGAPPLGKVTYQNLWEGISVTYEPAKGGIAESTYHIAPGADVSRIQLSYNVPVLEQGDGSLRFSFKNGYMSELAPVAWQEIGGKHVPVEVSFRVSGGKVGFSVAKYDSGFPLTIDPTYVWHTFYGSGGYDDYGTGITVDGSGNVYVTGYSGASWLGDGSAAPLHAFSGSDDIFVLKLNTSGTYQWHTFYGSADRHDYGIGITVDGSGNVYVTGYSYASWLGDGSAAPLHAFSGSDDIFVLKLNTSGAYQWHTFYGSADDHEYGYSITVDGSGNVYVTGQSYASWLGDGSAAPLHTFSGYLDIFVLKLNTSGAYQWHTFYGANFNDDAGSGITVDGSGNVYVTGYSYASWLGDGSAAPLHAFSGDYDIFVLKLNTSGAYQWHTFYGSAGDYDYGISITVDGSGNVYVTGYNGASWLGDGSAAPLHAFSGSDDIFVLKLNTSGAYQWHTFYGSAGVYDYGEGISVDSSGNVYVTGYSSASWLGDGSAAPLHAFSGSDDIFILKLNTSGTYQWHTFYGSTGGSDDGYGITVDGSGNVYVTGYSSASWLGDGSAAPLHAFSGNYDIFVLKMSDPPATAIPTMNEWGTIIFMALAGLGSVYYLRRQRRTEH